MKSEESGKFNLLASVVVFTCQGNITVSTISTLTKTDSLLIESSPGRFGGDLIGGRRFLRLAVGSGGEKTRHN